MTNFPQDGIQSLPIYHDFRVGGVEVRDQYFDLVAAKEFYLGRSIDPSGYLGFWNALDKTDYGKFAVTTSATPDDHEVYINYAIGMVRFSSYETWVSAYADYTSLGSVPMASGFNQTNRALEDVQGHLLTDGVPRLDTLEGHWVNASGAFQGHLATHIDVAHPGVLARSKQHADTLYKDTVPTLDLGFADPSGQRTLQAHFTNHPAPYWGVLRRHVDDPTTIAQAIADVSGQLVQYRVTHDAEYTNYKQNIQTQFADLTTDFRALNTSVSGQLVAHTVLDVQHAHPGVLADDQIPTTITRDTELATVSGVLQAQLTSTLNALTSHAALDIQTAHTGVLLDAQIPATIARAADVIIASGVLQQQLTAHAGTSITSAHTGVLLDSQIPVSITRGIELTSMRDDLQASMVDISGVLQQQLITHAGLDIEHAHTGMLIDAQIPSTIARDAELIAVSGVLQGQLTAHTDTSIQTAHTGVLADAQIPATITRDAELTNVSGVLQTQITANHAWAGAASGVLQAQLLTKEPAINAGNTEQVWRGDKEWVDFDQWVVAIPSISGAIVQAHTQNTDTGTSNNAFQIGTGGPKLKNNGGIVEVRNAGDSEYGDLRVNNMYITGTTVTTNYETIDIVGNAIILNTSVSGVPTDNAWLEVQRGTSPNARVMWDESNDRWLVGVSGSLSRVMTTGSVFREDYTISTNTLKLTNITVPNGRTYINDGKHMQVLRDGMVQLLDTNAGAQDNDYWEVNTTTVRFNYALPVGSLVSFIIIGEV